MDRLGVQGPLLDELREALGPLPDTSSLQMPLGSLLQLKGDAGAPPAWPRWPSTPGMAMVNAYDSLRSNLAPRPRQGAVTYGELAEYLEAVKESGMEESNPLVTALAAAVEESADAGAPVPRKTLASVAAGMLGSEGARVTYRDLHTFMEVAMEANTDNPLIDALYAVVGPSAPREREDRAHDDNISKTDLQTVVQGLIRTAHDNSKADHDDA